MAIIKTLSGIAAAALAICMFGCSAPKEEPLNVRVKPLGERQKAPRFEMKDAAGATATLADYEGKVLLLNFWATWCGPCKAEIPWFQEFDKKYKDRGFSVLGVSLDSDGWESVRPYIKERNITYRIVIGDDAVSSIYGGVGSLPTTFMIDREGKIAVIHTGLESKATYQKEIETLLEDKHAQSGGAAGQYAFFRAPFVRAE
jgi:cytochrome c biogenesis protein CcmG/thiol:disulfide interchange protein DsbE